MNPGPKFRIVSEHVARHPVSRAIERANITQQAALFATRVFMLEDGEMVSEDLDAAAATLGLAEQILKARQQRDPVINGGLSALTEMARLHCRWAARNATAVDQAMQRATTLIKAASAVEKQKAWLEMGR